MEFSFKARDSKGLLVTGTKEGESSDEVFLSLEEQGLIPISVTAGKKSFNQDLSSLANLDLFKTVKPEEMTLFTRQFYTLFKAGMDIETILDTLARQTKNVYFSEILTKIKNDVASGSNLARAFSQHPKVFNDLYCSVLSAGEEAGILEESLSQLSTLLEKSNKLTQAVKSATLYPKIVVFVLVMGIVAVMMFVIPELTKFYGQLKADLPWATKALMALSNFFVNYWYIAGLSVGAFVFLFNKWKATPKGKMQYDRFRWALPVFGSLGQKVANARFANTLAALYKSGLPITRGLEITSTIVDHELFSKDILSVKSEIEKGRGIAEAMRSKPYFSPLVIEATSIGERSGAIDDMYFAIGEHFDDEVDHMLKNLTTLLEPILLACVFAVVALLMFAIFLPLIGITDAVFQK